MNENENSDLAALARLVSTAYPSVISSKERDAFIASCTVHHEVAAAKGENQPTATAVQLVKDMFPDLGTGFVEELIGFYRGKTEEIINALLEDNLHPQVAGLSRTLRSKTEIEKGLCLLILSSNVNKLQIQRRRQSYRDCTTKMRK